MYYIYHIEGVKVGCTKNLAKRITVQQGYSNFEILAKTKCIDEASKLEFEWQNKLGYKNDVRTYKQTINNFMLHITKTTVTFKKTFNKTFDNYTWPSNIKLDKDYDIELNNEVKNFILKNNFKSAHNNERYIYSQSLKNFWDIENKPKLNLKIFDDNKKISHSKDKTELFIDSMFHIAIENNQAIDYFTEKLIDCFVSKTIVCPSISRCQSGGSVRYFLRPPNTGSLSDASIPKRLVTQIPL